MMEKNIKICVVGLGYVGLPLAVEFSKFFRVVGFDVKEKRVDELKQFVDKTKEVSEEDLKKSNIYFTTDSNKIKECSFIIIAVPTPVTKSKKPDLTFVENAFKTVGGNLAKGSTVVLESTVYPGVTEEIGAKILEEVSGLVCGKDFKIGYSPERVNPNDKEHTIPKIVKIVSGMDDKTRDEIAEVYGKIIKAGIFKAKDIKTAEAAKVIENVQRDLNIALINELSLIFEKMGLDTHEVLEAASTKWNFQKFTPGLVGGHCIGIDPYYLTYKALELGYHPKVILAGRDINDYMPKYVAELVVKGLNNVGKVLKDSSVLVLGLAFKENVNDTRNSKVLDLINELREYSISVYGHDPKLNQEEVEEFRIKNIDLGNIGKKFDGIVLAVAHNEFKNIKLDSLLKITNEKPVLIDVKGIFNKEDAIKKGFYYKRL